MSPRSKREYIEAIFLRYKKASPKQKTLILKEFCATWGCHRKHAICMLRRFKRFAQPHPNKGGRSPLYHPSLFLKPLKRTWLAANLPCSKRLKALLPLWLPGYIESFGPLPPQTLNALHRISAATIDRLLRPGPHPVSKKKLYRHETRILPPKTHPLLTGRASSCKIGGDCFASPDWKTKSAESTAWLLSVAYKSGGGRKNSILLFPI